MWRRLFYLMMLFCIPLISLAQDDFFKQKTIDSMAQFPKIAFSADEQTLVVSGLDNSLRFIDVPTGNIRWTTTIENRINSLVPSPDGTHMISGNADGTLSFWNLETGEVDDTWKVHEGDHLHALAVHGNRIFTGSVEEQAVKVWDLETGDLLATFDGFEAGVMGLDVSPDGTRVVAYDSDDMYRILDGETLAEITSDDIIRALDIRFSPDGTRIAISNPSQTGVAFLDAETLEILTTFRVEAASMVWSPDGNAIYVGQKSSYISMWDSNDGKRITGQGEHLDRVLEIEIAPQSAIMASADSAGQIVFWSIGEPTILQEPTLEPTATPEPREISPNTIVFTSERDGNREIYIYEMDEDRFTNLSNHPADDYMPAFSPDGMRIAFVSERDGNAEIYVMNADGTELFNITNSPANEESPNWGPRGDRILFGSDRLRDFNLYQVIGIRPSNAGDASQVSREQGDETRGDWSMNNNGRYIAYTVTAVNNAAEEDIYLYDTRRGNTTRITNTPGADGGPKWSPDGTNFVFSSKRSSLWAIYAYDMETGEQTLLLDDNANSLFPEYSPDGSRILFLSDRSTLDGSASAPSGNIFVMDADGTNLQQITNYGGREVPFAPHWSPDGTQIVWTEDNQVYYTEVDNPDREIIRVSDEKDYDATWRPLLDD